MSECCRCSREARPGGVLCGEHAAQELRRAVEELLGSATPNPVDHPTMTWAWQRARLVLERAGHADNRPW